MMKHSEIKDAIGADTLSNKAGVFTARREFFYRHGFDAQQFAALVKSKVPNAQILDSGEIWKPFRGGASTANSSHWFVKFQVTA